MLPAKPNLEVFAETLLELAQVDPDLVVVTSDSRGSARLGRFCQELPERVVEVGIAEQNLVGLSAGLAMGGKKVFAISPACFLTARALEQIKNDLAYSDHPVKLVGISAGVSYGALGSTHHSLHDLAALQAIHNLAILVPGDNHETRQTVRAALAYPHPLYLRFGKAAMPHLPCQQVPFTIGRARVLSQGRDVTFVACGEAAPIAEGARQRLADQGVEAGLISLPSLKPFDENAILQAARSTRAMLTVEEHSLHGGLGARCAALLLQEGVWLPFKIIALPDEDTVPGSQAEIFAHYGLTPAALAQAAIGLLSNRH
jgi:transketolase